MANTTKALIPTIDNKFLDANGLKTVSSLFDDKYISKNNLISSYWYFELLTIKNSGKLVPGCKYRITDYVTTTTEEGTKSAGHQFDIIVEAISNNELSEIASVALNEYDTYFTSCNLSAWEIKYCFDNDTNRFAWADPDNGTGVIYYMKDEHNNECPYDFKNIMFYTDKYTENTTPDNYYYTFSYVVDNVLYDGTVESQVKKCYDNVIKEYLFSGKQYLNKNIFRNIYLGNECYSNTFKSNCFSNIFGSNCSSNTFGDYCYNNTFGDECLENTFGGYCFLNTFGYSCCSNTLGDNCQSNTLGDNCQSNTLGDNCQSNTFGERCSSNIFGSGCYSNTFGERCSSNIFGSGCYSNTLGDSCSSNTLGISCQSNTLGISCQSNTFGDNCSANTFGNDKNNPKSYYRYIVFNNGNKNINLNCTATLSSLSYYQNVLIGFGVNNSNTVKTINDSNVGQTYETNYKPANSQTIIV